MATISSLTQNEAFKRVIKYFMIVVGSAIYAVGFQFFMYPNNIVSGGVTGISMIINHFTGFPVGMMSIIMNVPLFLIAWKHFGLPFLIGSLAGTVFSSAFVDIFAMTGISLTNDPMLASIIGGVIKGFGYGLIFFVGATTGGVDIIAKFVRQKNPHINFGTIILIIDVSVVTAYALVLDKYESAMYSLICMFVMSRAVDLVLYGLDNSNICYIVSEHTDDIVSEITLGQLHRGVTLLHAEGAYSHEEKQVIMCVIKRPQIAAIRRMVRAIDPKAFMVVTDAKNVFGKGFDSIVENS